jgi:hypothetical protein
MSNVVKHSKVGNTSAGVPAYYVLDHTKLTFGELLRMCVAKPKRFPYAIELVFAKLAHRPVRSGVPVQLHGCKEIHPDEIPEKFRLEIDPCVRYLEAAGFKPVFAFGLVFAKGIGAFGVELLAPDQMCWANVSAMQVSGSSRTPFAKHVVFLTKRTNGRRFSTSDSASQQGTSSDVEVQRIANATIADLLRLHRRRILDCLDAESVNESDIREFISNIGEDMAKCSDPSVFVPATEEELRTHKDQIVVPGALIEWK